MTREESMEYYYEKMARLYTIGPEQLDYRNIFGYIPFIGSVIDTLMLIYEF